ncbi:hypothetical protein N9N28_09455 [Rubripirellula amarantea]|nr:hypothetical protein [Rubripirellula amarantea]MDA8744843.1 hypothetical protein [Rubripirellula amarantea]
MENLSQIEAAAASLPPEQQRELLVWLTQRVGEHRASTKSQSVLDAPESNVGQVLSHDEANSDLLDEMLENRTTWAAELEAEANAAACGDAAVTPQEYWDDSRADRF